MLFINFIDRILPGSKSSTTTDLKTMSQVFTEIYYLRAAFETLPSGVRDSMLNHYKSEVLRKYGMTDSAFEHQIALYNANPSGQALEEEVSKTLVSISILIRPEWPMVQPPRIQ